MTTLIPHRQFMFASLIATALGVTVFAWYHDWIVVSMPILAEPPPHSFMQPVACKKKVAIIYRKQEKNVQETNHVLWGDNLSVNARTLVHAWAAMLEEEGIVHHRVTLQSASATFTNEELIISFDRAPFNKNDSAREKLHRIETLLATLALHLPSLQTVRFLVNHEPLNDYHLDFSQPWPLRGFLEAASSGFVPEKPLQQSAQRTIMIDPAGDATTTGRVIDDLFERTITLHCAQRLKQKLEQNDPSTRVILTRHPGETVAPLQNASFANRCNVDLFISIHCYQESSATHHCGLAYCTYHPLAQQVHTTPKAPAHTPVHLAYRGALSQSGHIVAAVNGALCAPEYRGRFVVDAPQAFPCAPLIGVTAPAFALELGLAHRDDWQIIIDAVAKALSHQAIFG